MYLLWQIDPLSWQSVRAVAHLSCPSMYKIAPAIPPNEPKSSWMHFSLSNLCSASDVWLLFVRARWTTSYLSWWSRSQWRMMWVFCRCFSSLTSDNQVSSPPHSTQGTRHRIVFDVARKLIRSFCSCALIDFTGFSRLCAPQGELRLHTEAGVCKSILVCVCVCVWWRSPVASPHDVISAHRAQR